MTITAGTQTQVNTNMAGYQYNPQIVGLDGGGWVILWNGDDGSYSEGVCQRVYDADGNAVGFSDIVVNTFTTGQQSQQRITALDGGGWVVTWTSINQDGFEAGIYQRVYDADGTPIGSAEQQVNTTFDRGEMQSRVAALEGGGWVVSWESYDYNLGDEIRYLQAFDADGNALGGEQQLNASSNAILNGVEIEALSDGGWVAVWTQFNANYTTSIYQQRFDRDGTPLSLQEELVNTIDGSFTVTDVIGLDGGGYLVTWSTPDAMSAGAYNTKFRAYDADGQPLASAEASLSTTPNSRIADVAALPGGGWVATWTEGTTNAYTVNQQVYDAGGVALFSAPQVVSTNPSLYHSASTVTVLEGGRWALTWVSYNLSTGMSDVYTQAFNANGDAYEAARKVNSQSYSSGVAGLEVAAVGGASWTITWGADGNDNDGYGIAQRTFHVGNNAPVAQDVTISVAEDSSYRFSASSFAFSDVDGDALSAVVITALPASGTLKLDGQTVSVGQQIGVADLGNLVWKPPANANGTDYASLSFKIVDDGDASVGGPATSLNSKTFTFNVLAANDAPEAVADSASMSQAETKIIDVLANDSDADGDTLVVSVATVVSDNGTVTINTDGTLSVTYDGPNLRIGQTATIKILYFASDGVMSNPATARITVNGGGASAGQNEAPEGENTRVALLEDGSHLFSADDFGFSDADGDELSAVIITALPARGRLELNGALVTAGTRISAADLGNLSWTPPDNANGKNIASLSFKVVDDGGTANGGQNTSEDAKTITFNVQAVNDAPIAVADSATMREGEAKILDVLANDRDPDNDSLSVSSVAVVSGNGSASTNADGTLSISYLGPDLSPRQKATITVLYTVSDSLLSNPGMASITVSGDYGEDDRILGSKRNDRITGTEAAEEISGLGGADLIRGGAGIDRLIGGRGNDRLEGGSGSDTFVFAANSGIDTILDFGHRGANSDVIDLSEIAAITDFADLLAHHVESRGAKDILIRFDDANGVIVKGMSADKLEADMFVF